MSYDLHIESVPPTTVSGSRVLTFGNYDTPLGVQGFQKLVDRYLKCLCTPKGTDLSDSNYGTVMMSLFLNNLDGRSIKQAALSAVQDAETQIRALDINSEYPNDERLASASVEYVQVDDATPGFEISVLLTNMAGTTIQLLLPLVYQRTRPPTS